jgi:hypothetical protein
MPAGMPSRAGFIQDAPLAWADRRRTSSVRRVDVYSCLQAWVLSRSPGQYDLSMNFAAIGISISEWRRQILPNMVFGGGTMLLAGSRR